MLRAASKSWSGPSQNRWKPCSCTVMCGSKATHARHWRQTVHSLRSWALTAIAGTVSLRQCTVRQYTSLKFISICVTGLGCSCKGCSGMSLQSSSCGLWLRSSACARIECLSLSLRMQTLQQSWPSTPCSLAVASTGECHAGSEHRALSRVDLLTRAALPVQPCRCLWHLSQNISKKLKKAMGADALQELTRCFRAAVYATTEPEMRAKWGAVMQVRLCVLRPAPLPTSSLDAAVLACSAPRPVMLYEVFDTIVAQ